MQGMLVLFQYLFSCKKDPVLVSASGRCFESRMSHFVASSSADLVFRVRAMADSVLSHDMEQHV